VPITSNSGSSIRVTASRTAGLLSANKTLVALIQPPKSVPTTGNQECRYIKPPCMSLITVISYRGSCERIRVDVRRDLVGTRCSASVLGLSSRTRGSASLPFDFFTAPGLRGDRSRNCGTATLVATISDPPAFQSAPAACPVRRARVPR
jgi:hypothetical protein